MAERIYLVTNIEVDGFVPGAHSMLAFASVAVTAAGDQVGEFEAVLERLPGAHSVRTRGRGGSPSRRRCSPPRRTARGRFRR